MKQLILSFVFMVCIFLNDGFASSLMTPENAEVGGIARAMRMYQTLNQGQLPTNWAQLRQVYNLDVVNSHLVGRQSYPIEDHYQFITQPLLLSYPVDGRVLMIRTVPLENLSEPDKTQRQRWRYLIYQNKKGDILSKRIAEKEVQNMLNSAGMKIIPKAGLPAVETDERIPGTEPTPQPNPADAAFLTQHPELDPSKKASSPASSIRPLASPSPTLQPLLAKHPAPKNEAPLSMAWLYSLAAIILAGLCFIIYRSRSR